jgi:hypothetical protein
MFDRLTHHCDIYRGSGADTTTQSRDGWSIGLRSHQQSTDFHWFSKRRMDRNHFKDRDGAGERKGI